MVIEPAAAADLDGVAEIYAHEVLTGAVTFDLEPPPPAHWHSVLAGVDADAGHHLLVARSDGQVVGWTKSGTWRPKAAYAQTVETTVYVASGHTGTGVGHALYAALFDLLAQSSAHRAVAGITQPNPASVALHERFGFRHVGTFAEVGRKAGRWWDVAWYERPV